MRNGQIRSELESLAAAQWGLFTCAQAREVGVGRTQLSRLLSSGSVELLRRGTYHIVGADETENLAVKAAWLSLYPKATATERLAVRPYDAVVASISAAKIHGIVEADAPSHTFVVRDGRQSSLDDISLRRWTLAEADVVLVDGLPVTTMERTIADLARESHSLVQVVQSAKEALMRDADPNVLKRLLEEVGPTAVPYLKYLMPMIDDVALRRSIADLNVCIRELDRLVKDVLFPHGVTDDVIRERLATFLDWFDNVVMATLSEEYLEAAHDFSDNVHELLI